MHHHICIYCKKEFLHIRKERKYCGLQCYHENNRGKTFTDERKANISKALYGKKHNQAFREKARQRQLGIKRTDEAKQKTSLTLCQRQKEHPWGFKKGMIPHNKGKPFLSGHPRHKYDEEFKKKISNKMSGKIPWNKDLNSAIDGRLAIISSKMMGINNPAYINGDYKDSKYPPEFSQGLRRRIRERDKYQCQICLKMEEKFKYKLGIHHIDYDKNNNHDENFICLCRSCHAKTNFKRNEWQEKLTQVITHV